MITAEPRNVGSVIRISEQTLRLAEHEAIESPGREIGGILVGWWEREVAVVIELLTVPDARAGRFHYQRRYAAAQTILDRYRVEVGDDRVGYLGEWHSHPAAQPPSGTDRRAISAVAGMHKGCVAMVVLAVRLDGRVDVHGALACGRWPRRTILQNVRVERTTP